MFAILFWEDSTFSVVALSAILAPRKELNQYAVGDDVEANFQGKRYKAKIYEIGGKYLYIFLHSLFYSEFDYTTV